MVLIPRGLIYHDPAPLEQAARGEDVVVGDLATQKQRMATLDQQQVISLQRELAEVKAQVRHATGVWFEISSSKSFIAFVSLSTREVAHSSSHQVMFY